MSFWMKTKVEIKEENLGIFKDVCKKHGIEYHSKSDQGSNVNLPSHRPDVVAILRDTAPGARQFYKSEAWLVRDQNGTYHVELDNDPRYSSITNRLGKDGGRLLRDYTVGVIERRLRRDGGMINSVTENPDGSVVLRASVMR